MTDKNTKHNTEGERDVNGSMGSAATEFDIDRLQKSNASLRAEVDRLRAAQITALYHPDDYAVQTFANAMIEKMALSRAKGRGGWEACTWLELWGMLREHVEKGDPVDVANLAMMIWHNARAARADKTPEHKESE